MREVGLVGLNLRRAHEAALLADRFAGGEVTQDRLPDEIARIRRIPPRERWVIAAAATVAGGAFSQIIVADAGALAAAATGAGLGQIVRSQVQTWQASRAAATMVCTLCSALVAALLIRLGLGRQAIAATLIGSIIYCAPGMLLINGYLDMTNERFLFIGLQRLIHAVFLFLIMTLSVFIANALL